MRCARRGAGIDRARELDVLRQLTEDSGGEYEIWPPEGNDRR